MADSLLSSEEYDERAHRLYDDGQYDTALATLKEGLRLYPHSVELYVGLGYTQLAREDYVWAKQAFERSLVLDPNHEDALIGLGESLLRFGRRDDALAMFERARANGGDDLEMLMSMGRALYREKMYEEAHRVFDEAATLHGESAEAAAALGYTLHRLGDGSGARRHLRRALLIDELHYEARIYLGHLLYDRSDWAGALREFERIRPAQHWDVVAVGRTIELKRALEGLQPGDGLLIEWERRLDELQYGGDPLDTLLSEVEALSGVRDVDAVLLHRVVLTDGRVVEGTWLEIVVQLRDLKGGGATESVIQFMNRCAEEERERRGISLPADDAASFVRGGERAGLWRIEA